MEHEGWDIEDARWIQLDYLWLISAEILIRVQPLQDLPPISRSRKYGRSYVVNELRIGLLSDKRIRILTRPLGEECWEKSVYSGTFWYGLYTGSGEEPF